MKAQRVTGASSSGTPKEQMLRTYQRAVFSALFLGYACYTYNRKSVSYALPTLLTSGLITTATVGAITSCQNTAYAISKFLGGVLSDRISARLLFSMGLALSGASTLLFSRTEDPRLWALLWFANGFAQGAGWPACAKLLKKWFSPANFGTWWSVLTASSNVSGTASPLLAAYVIVPPRERLAYSGRSTVHFLQAIHVIAYPLSVPITPFLWVVSVSYMVVFCSKTALSDWGQIYLIEELGRSQMQGKFTCLLFYVCAYRHACTGPVPQCHLPSYAVVTITPLAESPLSIETRGFLISFYNTLWCFVITECIPSVVIALILFCPPQLLVSAVGVLLGASMFGPISIYGIVASESFPAHLSGTAHAVVALAANVGAVVAGWPLSWVARTFSWNGVFLLLEILAASSVLLILLSRRIHITLKAKEQ
nr:glucose-6-phosphate exchanger SLC37A4-like [Penaeus vannamei]